AYGNYVRTHATSWCGIVDGRQRRDTWHPRKYGKMTVSVGPRRVRTHRSHRMLETEGRRCDDTAHGSAGSAVRGAGPARGSRQFGPRADSAAVLSRVELFRAGEHVDPGLARSGREHARGPSS